MPRCWRRRVGRWTRGHRYRRSQYAGRRVVRAHVAAKEAGLRLLVGARLDLTDAPGLICYPTDRAAYGRLCRLLSLGQGRAGKGQCMLALADVAEHAEGQVFIALPPDTWRWQAAAPPRTKARLSGAKILKFAEAASSSGATGDAHRRMTTTEPSAGALVRIRKALGASPPLYLAAAHTYRGDYCARIAALAVLAKRYGTPLIASNAVLSSRPASPSITRRAPPACEKRQRSMMQACGLKRMPSATSSGPLKWHACFSAMKVRAGAHA